MEKHIHDLAFIEGGEGVYCVNIDCDFTLTGDSLLSFLKKATLNVAVERESEDEFWSRFWAFIEERVDKTESTPS